MNNLRGIALMIGAMAMFTIADTCIKTMAQELPRGEILGIAGLSGMVFFAVMLGRGGEHLFDRRFFSRVILMRNSGEVFGTLGIFTALTLIPISTVSAIMQTAPLFATIGAALVLGEAVGWRRWVAIVV
jgi:drug/metabolite transporter (DMT)-like permease